MTTRTWVGAACQPATGTVSVSACVQWCRDAHHPWPRPLLGAENSYNLFTVRKNSDAATDEERGRLEVRTLRLPACLLCGCLRACATRSAVIARRTRAQTVGQYHLGEFVNRFRPGSLVMRLPDSGELMPAAGEVRLCAPARRANLLPLVCSPACPDLGCLPTMLYACVSGALGVVVSLPREQYLLLERLQVGAGRRLRFGCTCVRAHRREGGGGGLQPYAGRCMQPARAYALLLCCLFPPDCHAQGSQGRGRAGPLPGAPLRVAEMHPAHRIRMRSATSRSAPSLRVQWRAFCNPFTPPGTGTCRQFVDGDLVEQFLDLK